MKKVLDIIIKILWGIMGILGCFCGVIILYAVLNDENTEITKNRTATNKTEQQFETNSNIENDIEINLDTSNENTSVLDTTEQTIPDYEHEQSTSNEEDTEFNRGEETPITENDSTEEFDDSQSMDYRVAFFLNNITGMTAEEVINGMGEPSHSSTTYGLFMYYYDVELFGINGKISIQFHGGYVQEANWCIEDIDVDIYQNEVKQMQEYLNDRYFIIDTYEWKDGKTEIAIIGLITVYSSQTA